MHTEPRALAEHVQQWLVGYSHALTRKRVHGHAIILAAAVWLASLWIVATPGPFDRNGTLKGIDFLQFYTAGRLVATGRGHLLYDWALFAHELDGTVPGLQNSLFLSVYPPPLAVLFAPLGGVFSYLPALAIWTLISIALYAMCAWRVWRALPVLKPYQSTWWLLVFGFVPFQQLVMHGQIGTLVVAALTCAYLAIRRERWFWAGAACGALLFKPQFGVATVLLIIVSCRVPVLIGVVAGGGIVMALSVLAVGIGPWLDYAHKIPVLLEAAPVFEPKIWQMHNLKGFVELLAGSGVLSTGLTALASIGVVALVVGAWRATPCVNLRMAALLLGTALLNPHLYVYDLIIVGLALALCAAWALDHPDASSSPAIIVLTHTLCWVPLLAPLARLTHLQLTAALMAALLCVVNWAAHPDHRASIGVNHRFHKSALR